MKVVKAFWQWYVGLGDAGKVAVGDPNANPNATGKPAPEGEKEVEVNGVKYKQDEDGNYLLNGVPVMDSKQVPFKNRAAEQSRKLSDAEAKLADAEGRLNQNETELDQLRQDVQDLREAGSGKDEDYDEETGLTNKAIKALGKKFGIGDKKVTAQKEAINDNRQANINIKQELASLKADEEFKDFFASKEFVEELGNAMKQLTVEGALMEGVVQQMIYNIRGRHVKDIVKSAKAEGAKTANEQRKIEGELELGGTAGATTTEGGLPVDDEVRKLAKDGRMSVEKAASVVHKRRERNKKREDK